MNGGCLAQAVRVAIRIDSGRVVESMFFFWENVLKLKFRVSPGRQTGYCQRRPDPSQSICPQGESMCLIQGR